MDETVGEVVSMTNSYINYYIFFPKEEASFRSEEDIWEYCNQLHMVFDALDFAY